jgi:hypothetical protein
MPVTFSCADCHKTYADLYNAPNLTNTGHNNFDCVSANCHPPGADGTIGALDTLAEHNLDATKNVSSRPNTETVYLNGNTSISVPKGSVVTITSRINDSYVSGSIDRASRVRGAEYYINSSPGEGKGMPLNAEDGSYDSVNGAPENVTGTIDTSTLSTGTYTIYVRSMDIGKQWSSEKSATLTVTQDMGYINGTVRNSTDSPIMGAKVTVAGTTITTVDDGNYSFRVDTGTYDVIASKLPEYNDYTATGVGVTSPDTTVVNIVLLEKPKGTITGTVTIG